MSNQRLYCIKAPTQLFTCVRNPFPPSDQASNSQNNSRGNPGCVSRTSARNDLDPCSKRRDGVRHDCDLCILRGKHRRSIGVSDRLPLYPSFLKLHWICESHNWYDRRDYGHAALRCHQQRCDDIAAGLCLRPRPRPPIFRNSVSGSYLHYSSLVKKQKKYKRKHRKDNNFMLLTFRFITDKSHLHSSTQRLIPQPYHRVSPLTDQHRLFRSFQCHHVLGSRGSPVVVHHFD